MANIKREDLRNIAIIAHVDHGKTTLVDQMLHSSGVFRENEHVQERVMDSNELERERGITILSKNTAVTYDDVKINILDTPGHADFGGEVERILMMVDGVLLLVDAFEGCMPQTRFVLKKALGQGKKSVVVINKIDRDGARPDEVIDEIIDLFIELDANDDQLDFPVIFASGRDGYATLDPTARSGDMRPLFETIIKHIPAPEGEEDAPLQLLFSNIDYDDYVGRIGIGRVERGTVKKGDSVVIASADGESRKGTITKLYQFDGLGRVEEDSAKVGDLVAVTGISDLNIGETACDPDHVEPMPFIDIDEPTIAMFFSVNDSPFAGREGKYVTSRNIRDRLFREIKTNVSMHVEETDSTDAFKVSGRGELHLSVLIETMRREGYEFAVSRPEVIYKHDQNNKIMEPIETLMIEVPDEYVGVVMERLGRRKAEIVDMVVKGTGITHLEFKIPARGLMGYRQQFLTDTRGTGIMNSVFDKYDYYQGEIPQRIQGSLVVFETGETKTYGLHNAQERGKLFIDPGVNVYEGMIVGESPRSDDIVVNVCRKKHITNIRASGSDDALRLTPKTMLSLEQSLEFINDDELVEVTPLNIRLRKKILQNNLRGKKKK